MSNAIVVQGANKRYGDFVALDNVDFEVPAGSLMALLGPSGSGKSTLLRAIAGLDQPDSGTITINGRDVTRVPPQRRDIGFVFQHFAAFKHMTVRDNVAFGLKIRRRPKAEVTEKVDNLLNVVGLSGFQNRYPNQLSGGQRQRMALARALAVDPQVLLLDEPFGALDAKVRKELRRWLRRLHDELHITSIFVTHDQEEALEVADQVVLMNKGKVEQVGTPDEVYEHPASPFVYGFLGTVNVFHGRASDGRFELGPVSVEAPEHRDAHNAPAVAYVRPHEIEIERSSPGLDGLPVQLTRILVVGPTARLELERQDSSEILEVEIPATRARSLDLKLGETLRIRPRRMQVFLDGGREAPDRERTTPARPVPARDEAPVHGTVIR